MLQIGLYISTAILLLVTVLPLFPSNHWSVRVWEFPRVQLATLLFVNLVASILILSGVPLYSVAFLSLIALIYQLVWIFPYTVLFPTEVNISASPDAHSTIKILTSNVLMPNRSANKLIDIVKSVEPDILVTLETDDWWESALSPLHDYYPHRANRPLDNLYGMHLFSKYELRDVEICDIIEQGVPSIHCYVKLPNGVWVKCHFLHPAPPSPTENTTAKPRDKELLYMSEKVGHTTEPTIVTGDLNDVAWSPTTRAFRHKSNLKDPRIGRGFFNTFHAQYPILRWPLDHIFHSDHFDLVSIKRMKSIDSDHFPLLSELAFTGAKRDNF